MGPSFDPYYKWLGIPPEEQPPNHYRLLGVRDFETDPDVIQAAADQRMAHLRTYQTSQYAEWSQRLLNEVAAAKIRLLNPAKKPAYDRQLRETMQPEPAAASEVAFAIVVDEPRLRTSYSLHPKRRLPVGAIIGGVLAISVVAAVGLVYWSITSREAPAVAAKPNGQPTDRNDQNTARVKKPQASLDTESAGRSQTSLTKDQAAPRVAAKLGKSSTDSSGEPKPKDRHVDPTASPNIKGTIVCDALIAKKSPSGLTAAALPFEAPPGDGRRGANGFLIPAPDNWAANGTAWGCVYRRDGSANGIHFIHPYKQGHVVVTFLPGVVHVDSPEKWLPGHLGYIPRSPGIMLDKSRDFERALDLSGNTWHAIGSILLASGRILVYVDQKLVATGQVAAEVPLELSEGFQGPKFPRRLWPGEGGVIVGPLDNPGFNEARSIEFGTAAFLPGTSPAKLVLSPDTGSQQTETVNRDSTNGISLVPQQGELKSQLPDRADVPAASAQEEALKLVHDLYKDDFEKAKTAEEKQALAKKLLAQAEAATSADAGAFVLLRLARDIAAQASNGETALAAVDAMSERYRIDALEMKAEMLFKCAKKARTPPQHLSVAEQAARLLDEATAAGNYAQAVNLVKLAAAEGGLSRSKEIVLWAKACLPDLQKKAKLATEFEAARSTLAADLNDPVANLTAGTYYGYLQGDWAKALPHLAKGTDANLQTLAQRELASPSTDIDAQVAVADAWWDAGQNAEGMKRLAMLRHAGSWYAKAQTETLGGLTKVKVEKRLEELAKAEREANVAGPGPRVFVPLGKWFSLLTSPNEPTGWEVGECRFSYANGVIDLRGREMYCPIVAKDATIRATVKRRNASCIRLFLRNSHRGCYFAQLTSGSWSIVKATRNPHGANQAAARMRFWDKADTLSTIRVTRNYSELVFEMAFAAAGDTLTVFMNRQPLLQAKDATFTEGTVGIGTDNTTMLFVTNVELLIPNKGSLVGDYRAPAGAAKP